MLGEERGRNERIVLTRKNDHGCASNDLHIFVESNSLTRRTLNYSFKRAVEVSPNFFTAFIDATYEYSISGIISKSEFFELAEILGQRLKMDEEGSEDFSDFVGNDQISYLEEAECNDKTRLVCYPDGVQAFADDFDVLPYGWEEITVSCRSESDHLPKYYEVVFLPLQNSNRFMMEPDWGRKDLISIQGPIFAGSLATKNYLNVVRGKPGELLVLIRDEHSFRYFGIRSKSYGNSLRIFFEDVSSTKIALNLDIFPKGLLANFMRSIQRKLDSCEGRLEYFRTSNNKDYSIESHVEARVVASYKAVQ